jgi:hypothetical protein
MIDTVAMALDYFESLDKPPPPSDDFLAKLGAYHEEQDLRIRADLKTWCSVHLEALAIT